MKRLNRNSKSDLTNGRLLARKGYGSSAVALFFLLTGVVMLSSCGGSSSSHGAQDGALSGNWQFTMTDPNSPPSTPYGLLGGFLLQSNGTVSGQALYVVSDSNGICNSGSATITGTVSGQTVTLTAVAGPQTFQLTGPLSTDGSGISNGTFTTAGGGMVNGVVCGAPTAQGTPGSWSAISVPALTGPVTGTFHSTGSTLTNQDFQVTGTLTQGTNIGASSATVTGNLSFIDPATQVTDYPCFPNGVVNVSGQISGNNVLLQLIGTDGSIDGQIGVSPAQPVSQFSPVTFAPATSGGSYILHSTGLGYSVGTKSCTGESGYVCLALHNGTPCQQPIILSPPALVFSPQLLVCTTNPQFCSPNQLGTSATQTVTLTNNQPAGSPPLTIPTPLQIVNQSGSDFTGAPEFTESDNCANFLASSTPGQSCSITITFAPQETCGWVPAVASGGLPYKGIAATCPQTLSAVLTVQIPAAATNDNDQSFSVSATGIGLSYVQPNVSEIDFGAQAVGETSQPQLLSFTNQSAYPVQIVGPQSTPCKFTGFNATTEVLPPILNNGIVSGLQVVTIVSGTPPAVFYSCDADPTTGLPEFRLSADTCTGALLAPQGTCNVELTFVPQPYYLTQAGLDYFVELNTVQCAAQLAGGAGSDCEIDSARFPVELRATAPSPLRMLPAGGLDFGGVPTGKTSPAAKTITLFNDPSDPKSATVNFLGKIAVTGSFSETDDCPFNLAPGASCNLNVNFKPSSTGNTEGWLEIAYTLGSATTSQTPQYVYLRGTGQ